MRLSSLVKVALVAAALFSANLVARADTVNFVFQGTEQTGLGGTATGTGTFSFTGSPATLGLSELTTFSFADTLNVNGFGSSTFTYSLADLSSFSAVLSGDTLVSLSLSTIEVPGTSGGFAPESFSVTSLAPDGASTQSGGTLTFLGQASQVSAVTPEPSTLALFGTGILGLAGMARRKVLA
jgi:hypothetical protein